MFKAWEPAKNLDNAKKAINGFEERQRKIIGSEFELEREPKAQKVRKGKNFGAERKAKRLQQNPCENENLQRLKDEQPANAKPKKLETQSK